MTKYDKLLKHFETAGKYISQGQVDKAIDEYKLMLLYAPNSPFIYCHLGAAYMHKNAIPQAIIYFQKAIELEKDYVDAHLYLGIAYLKEKNFDKAIEKFNKVIEMDKDSADAHLYLGEVYYQRYKLGLSLEIDEAEKMFRKVLELDPNNIDAYINLGKVYLEYKMMKEAQQYFRKADELKKEKLLTQE